MNKMKMSEIVQLRQSGIYCVKNESNKHVQIFGSRNILESISNLVKKIDSGEYGSLKTEYNNTDLEILEYIGDKDNLKVVLSGWIDRYKREGWTIYKDTNLVNYKVLESTCIINDKVYYTVYLQNRRKDKIILGLFDSKEQCSVWKNTYYPSDIITHLVYVDNEYTPMFNKIK